MLAKHLTVENHQTLLNKAVDLTKRELEWLVAQTAPQEDVADSIREMPRAKPDEPLLTLVANEAMPSQPARQAPPAVSTVAPLSAGRIMIRLSANRDVEAKIIRARELLAHKYPKGQLEDIVGEALDALLEKLAPERKLARKMARAHGQAKKAEPIKSPSRKTASCTSRYVPAAVRQSAWEEAGGQCTYVSPDGKRCAARRALEFDHVKPWALGGPSTLANGRILCQTHNRFAASKTFGPRQPWRT